VIEVIATLKEEDRATSTDNMHRKSDEVWTCGFRDIRVDRQTIRYVLPVFWMTPSFHMITLYIF